MRGASTTLMQRKGPKISSPVSLLRNGYMDLSNQKMNLFLRSQNQFRNRSLSQKQRIAPQPNVLFRRRNATRIKQSQQHTTLLFPSHFLCTQVSQWIPMPRGTRLVTKIPGIWSPTCRHRSYITALLRMRSLITLRRYLRPVMFLIPVSL
eukprot:Rmarinus@m.21936